MPYVQAIFAWIVDNYVWAVPTIIYLVVNIYPRRHPDDQDGWRKIVWFLLDRISVMTAEKVPGKFKLIFSASERQALPSAGDNADVPKK